MKIGSHTEQATIQRHENCDNHLYCHCNYRNIMTNIKKRLSILSNLIPTQKQGCFASSGPCHASKELTNLTVQEVKNIPSYSDIWPRY